MAFQFDFRKPNSSYVDAIWHTQTTNSDSSSFISSATIQWEMVVTKYQGETTLTVSGPETKASDAPIPEDAEFLGITFKLGTFMPHLTPGSVLDRNDVSLLEASKNRFWLHGATWQYPTFENVDTFVDRLVREGVLVREPMVEAVLQGQQPDLSLRTLQTRFLRATGVTQKYVQQIERVERARALLQNGVSILDTVYETGYFDQPHLTRSLKRFLGQTPAQFAKLEPAE